MTARHLLVVPLLSPLLAVLLLAALNPRPQLSFRVLTWTTPQAPLGLWLGGAALGGAALSGAGTALALGQGQGAAGRRGRRRVTTPRSSRAWGERGGQGGGDWDEVVEERLRRDVAGQEPWDRTGQEDPGRGSWRQPAAAVAPPRAPGDPAPTMDAPFRVLRRPPGSQEDRSAASSARAWEPPLREREPDAVAMDDDWGRASSGDDW